MRRNKAIGQLIFAKLFDKTDEIGHFVLYFETIVSNFLEALPYI